MKHQDAPGLPMSRSMGDSVAASVGCSAEPEVRVHALQSEDKFIVLASDGVWEFISNLECVKVLAPFYDRGDCGGAADELVREANARWRKEEEVIDDITCTVIFLNTA